MKVFQMYLLVGCSIFLHVRSEDNTDKNHNVSLLRVKRQDLDVAEPFNGINRRVKRTAEPANSPSKKDGQNIGTMEWKKSFDDSEVYATTKRHLEQTKRYIQQANELNKRSTGNSDTDKSASAKRWLVHLPPGHWTVLKEQQSGKKRNTGNFKRTSARYVSPKADLREAGKKRSKLYNIVKRWLVFLPPITGKKAQQSSKRFSLPDEDIFGKEKKQFDKKFIRFILPKPDTDSAIKRFIPGFILPEPDVHDEETIQSSKRWDLNYTDKKSDHLFPDLFDDDIYADIDETPIGPPITGENVDTDEAPSAPGYSTRYIKG